MRLTRHNSIEQWVPTDNEKRAASESKKRLQQSKSTNVPDRHKTPLNVSKRSQSAR